MKASIPTQHSFPQPLVTGCVLHPNLIDKKTMRTYFGFELWSWCFPSLNHEPLSHLSLSLFLSWSLGHTCPTTHHRFSHIPLGECFMVTCARPVYKIRWMGLVIFKGFQDLNPCLPCSCIGMRCFGTYPTSGFSFNSIFHFLLTYHDYLRACRVVVLRVN